jgi:predicted dehydrogenase/threonine dehydrogenase-like Zn-dependent dehydrogenase
MKQLFQHLDSGETALLDVPAPQVARGHVVVRSQASVVSAGTERMLVDFGKANPVQKARQQPEKVREVVDKARIDGVPATVSAVRSKLAQPMPLGYCNAGVVEAVGAGVHGVGVGDRVASNGPHAEVVAVGENLVAPIPEEVSFEAAAFAPLASIGLHGARLASPTLGERFVVIGLGLVGLLTVQVLRAHGCDVLGVDLDSSRVRLVRHFGAAAADVSLGEEPVEAAMAFTGGVGADGVLIAASTKSDEPVRQAAQMCRRKGRIVLIGVADLSLSRDVFYEKELSFQVSCSYGPGRYDPAHENGGADYPLPYVRWTEGRNFEAVLRLMVTGALDVEPLVTHRFDFDEAPRGYNALAQGDSSLGIVLHYPQAEEHAGGEPARPRKVTVQPTPGPSPAAGSAAGGVGVIGAGNYATQTVLPALAEADVDRAVVASSGGTSAGVAARRFGFRAAASDAQAVIDDPHADVVFVLTRHDSHASLAAAALAAGKSVFVEKPLAIDADGLAEVRTAWVSAIESDAPCLTVGFNRRFSPHVQRARQLLASVRGPKALVMTVNAGPLPTDHWLNDPTVGGGRLIGEGCHFVDLLRHLVGAPIVDVTATPLGDENHAPQSFTVTVRFADGSLGTVHYFAGGHRRFPKERLEVFAGGRTLVIDNFKRLRTFGWRDLTDVRTGRQDKGHRGLLTAFLAAAGARGPQPIPVDELFEVSDAVLQANAFLYSSRR